MPESKLVLRGKKATITLDADSGGIWMERNDKRQAGDGFCFCFGAGPGEANYFGIWGHGPAKSPPACDFAISVESDGRTMLQARSPNGTLVRGELPAVIDMLAEMADEEMPDGDCVEQTVVSLTKAPPE